MDSWIQSRNRQRQRDKQRNRLFADGAPFFGYCTGDANSDTESLSFSYHAGQRTIPTLHPYVGQDSWIRVGTEAGSTLVAAQRPDSNTPDLLGYANRNPDVKLGAYRRGAGMYRPLKPGEIELHSRGNAQQFLSNRPYQDRQGGMVRDWCDQDRLERGGRAPVHTRQLHLNRLDRIGDEERFGIVVRPDGSRINRKYVRAERIPDPSLAADVTAAGVIAGIIPDPGPWAKEHLRVLKSGSVLPEKLLDVREGDVFDDNGASVLLTTSGKPLRYKGEWFSDAPTGGAFFVGIDTDGNCLVSTTDAATVGVNLQVPQGDLNLQVGGGWINTVQRDFTLACQAATNWSSRTGFSYTATEGGFQFSPGQGQQYNIGLGDEPAVLGQTLLTMLTQLVTLLKTHTHIGNLGNPTPADPALVAALTQLETTFITGRTIVSDYVNLSKLP